MVCLASRKGEESTRKQEVFHSSERGIILAIRINLSFHDRITLVQFSTGTGQFTTEMINIALEKDVVNIVLFL